MADDLEGNNTLPQPPLALPPPPTELTDSDIPKVDARASGEAMKFDALGPLVVNSDGTLSRIANWPNMTEEERARTTRVLLARNQIRLAKQEAQ
ncbi:hypothetical protein BC835DRAFT_1419830 [Cytidiella melzeri]|nr:hypothetical protein BC835DRAFT_1419830 [Cytidiella melzeri]